MNYNDKLSAEYGKFIDLNGEYPMPAKPLPNKKDYVDGSFRRAFAKRINGNTVLEISMDQANRLNSDLYKVVVARWSISGPRENRKINGIIEYGVANANKYEIDRIKKEEDVDLSNLLVNPLEYWQGH